MRTRPRASTLRSVYFSARGCAKLGMFGQPLAEKMCAAEQYAVCISKLRRPFDKSFRSAVVSLVSHVVPACGRARAGAPPLPPVPCCCFYTTGSSKPCRMPPEESHAKVSGGAAGRCACVCPFLMEISVDRPGRIVDDDDDDDDALDKEGGRESEGEGGSGFLVGGSDAAAAAVAGVALRHAPRQQAVVRRPAGGLTSSSSSFPEYQSH